MVRCDRPQGDDGPDERGVERLGVGQALGELPALAWARRWRPSPESHRRPALDSWQRHAQWGWWQSGLGLS
jgi:hypothetical protein